MKISQAAIKARENAGLSVRELAEKAGYDYMTLYHFENSERACKITTVIDFADVLGISLDEYVGRNLNREYVVRCKDCVSCSYEPDIDRYKCNAYSGDRYGTVQADDYCSYGERKEM